MTKSDLKSIWTDLHHPAGYPQLAGDHSCDVVVVGAGITGLTTAFLLKKAGKKVIVVEGQRVGDGASGYTTAHLTTEYDHDYLSLHKAYGEEVCRLVAQSMSESIDRVESLASELKADCDFHRVSGFYYTESREDAAFLERQFELIRKLQLFPVLEAGEIPLPYKTIFGYEVPGQARMDPIPYLTALASAIDGDGSRVFERSKVTDYEGRPVPKIVTGQGSVSAEAVVLATHTPLGRSPLHALVTPMRSYAIAFTSPQATDIDGLFWDTSDPYYYLRRAESAAGPVLIVGGRDCKVGCESEKDSFAELESFIRDRFEVSQICNRWSAQFYEPLDYLPFIGHLPFAGEVYCATGFSGDGMTFGTCAGHMISEKILGRSTPYDDLYQPGRANIQGAIPLLKQGADLVKNFVGDRLPFGRTVTIRSALQQAEGAVVNVDGKRIAAVRAENGDIRAFSAVCPHMRCIVHWNAAQKTFDCPCHGSRFGRDGAVLEGPSLEGLAPLQLEQSEAEQVRT